MESVSTVNALYRDKRRRVWELDFLRGLAVILMCFDHLMFDFAYIRTWFSNFDSVKNPFVMWMRARALEYMQSDLRFYGHYIFVFLFLFLVGTSCAFSRDNIRRGAALGVFSLVFTGATFIVKAIGILDDGIIFGILHCIALCILCAAAVDNLTRRNKYVNILVPLALGTAICAAGIGLQYWNMGRPYDMVFTPAHMFDYIIGTHGFGDDWFGLFPQVGAVLLGVYFGKAAYSARVSLVPAIDGKWNKPFRFVGRHALLFYVIHQVAIAGLVILLCLCLGYRL